MNDFRLEDNKFKIFIKNSKVGLENREFDVDFVMPDIKELILENPIPAYVKRLLINLDILTQEGKIIWTDDFAGFYRGVVIKECRFSNFKIVLENENQDFENYGISNLNDYEPYYRINLIKDTPSDKRVEYVINFREENEEIMNLFATIEKKLIQLSN